MAGLNDSLGTKLGPRLAQLMGQAATASFSTRLPLEHQLRVGSTRTVVDWMGMEFGQVMAPLTDRVLKSKDIDPDVRRTIENMTSGANQWQALAGIAFGGSGIMSMLGTIMNNYLAPLTFQTVGHDPLLVPDPGVVSQLMARGLIDPASWQYAMSGQGLNSTWAQAMFEAAHTYPDVATLLTLWNRGIISDTQFEFFMVRGGFTQEMALTVLQTALVPLSVPDAALAVLRGNIDMGRAQKAAKDNGVTADDFAVIVDNTGEPPALQELLLLWRRGQVDDATLERGIRQSRVRDEWIGTIKKLGVMPPSPAEVIDSLVTGQTDMGTAARRWAEAGGDPTWFTTAWHTGGESPTPTELAVLANRGIIPWTGTGPTVTSYEQGFKESRFKDKWEPYYRELGVYLPPPRTVTALLHSGAIDRAEATKLLLDYGMDAQLVAAYTDDAHRAKTAKQRELAVGEIDALYQERAIARTDAAAMLVALGYDQTDADFILTISDLQRERKYTDAVIAAVHSRYTHHLIDRSTASSDLDAVQLAADQRDALLALWDLEASVNVKRLTEAQITSAYKKGIFTQDEAKTALMDQGYPDFDATVILLLAGAPHVTGTPTGTPGRPAT